MYSFVVAAVVLSLLQLGQPAAAAPQGSSSTSTSTSSNGIIPVPTAVNPVAKLVGAEIGGVPVVGPIVTSGLGALVDFPTRRGVLPDDIAGVTIGSSTDASETATTATVTSTFTETTITTTTITETTTSTDTGATTTFEAVHIGRRQENPDASSPGLEVVVSPMVLSENTGSVSV